MKIIRWSVDFIGQVFLGFITIYLMALIINQILEFIGS